MAISEAGNPRNVPTRTTNAPPAGRRGSGSAGRACHSDTRPAGDITERGLCALLGDDLARDVEDAFPVALGIGALPLRVGLIRHQNP
ncbi:hypothetical protein [Streptomyces sp. NPDC088748]|uniref:hypothetical protein n=1 Tax=Streptomyces sp. NPDC088748 TaxID=3365887 RepID=UPI00382565E9